VVGFKPWDAVGFEIGAIFAIFGGHPAGVAVEDLFLGCCVGCHG